MHTGSWTGSTATSSRSVHPHKPASLPCNSHAYHQCVSRLRAHSARPCWVGEQDTTQAPRVVRQRSPGPWRAARPRRSWRSSQRAPAGCTGMRQPAAPPPPASSAPAAAPPFGSGTAASEGGARGQRAAPRPAALRSQDHARPEHALAHPRARATAQRTCAPQARGAFIVTQPLLGVQLSGQRESASPRPHSAASRHVPDKLPTALLEDSGLAHTAPHVGCRRLPACQTLDPGKPLRRGPGAPCRRAWSAGGRPRGAGARAARARRRPPTPAWRGAPTRARGSRPRSPQPGGTRPASWRPCARRGA